MHHKMLWTLTKRANKGFQGYPVATVAFYGPDDRRASKVAVAIVTAEQSEPSELARWVSDDADVRDDEAIVAEILRYVERHAPKTIAMADRIIGCPHEEGIDYPEAEKCPKCPFWASRDRWTGEILH
jgi:hypothetical protein